MNSPHEKALGTKVHKTALGAAKSKRPNAMNMHFSVEDLKGQKKVSDANKKFRMKNTFSKD